jgi:hypothetical protein
LCPVSLPEKEPTRTPRPAPPGGSSRVTAYDLRDPEAGAQASTDLDAWGRQWTEIYILDNDHVAIEFKARGALEAAS